MHRGLARSTVPVVPSGAEGKIVAGKLFLDTLQQARALWEGILGRFSSDNDIALGSFSLRDFWTSPLLCRDHHR